MLRIGYSINMYDLVTVGTVTVDLYYKGTSLPFIDGHFRLAGGGKYFVDFFHEGVGGGAANVAIAAQKNGIKTALWAKIGNNSFKSFILEKLEAHKISTSLCDFEDDYMNVSSIFLNGVGEKTVVNYRTPHQKFFSDEDTTEKNYKTGAVYISNLSDVSLTERLKLIRAFHTRKVKIFMNLGVNDCRRPKDQLEELIKPVDILILNTHEFSDLVKTPLRQMNFKKVYVPQYWPFLREKTIVITDGERGSYGYSEGAIYYQKAVPPKKIIDTTGAGDGYTGSFIADFVCTGNMETAMRAGAEYSSKKLSHLGAN